MKYPKEDYYCNFSGRMQRNLVDAGFEFIDEQIYAKNENSSPKFWVYKKTYELQLFLGMFRLNNEKSLGYKECQIIKFYNERKLLDSTNIEDYEIKENKFTESK